MSECVEAIPVATKVESDKLNLSGVLTITAGHAIHDTYTGFLAPLLPTLIEHLSITNAQAGLLTVFMQWPSLFQPFLGHLADRFNLRHLFILAPAVTATIMSLLGIAPTYAMMAMLLVVAGLSSASLHAVGPAITGHLSGRQLGRGMGFWMVGGEMGRVMGPIVSVSAVALLGLRGLPWVMIAGILTTFLLWIQLRGTADQPIQIAQQAFPLKEVLARGGKLAPSLLGIIVAHGFTAAALSTYLPILLRDQGASLVLAGASLSIYEIAGVVGAFVGGMLSDRIGRRRMLFFSMLTTPLLMIVFLMVPPGWQLPFLLLLGFTSLSFIPVIMALVQEQMPDNRATITGVYTAMSFSIRALVVLILGLLADAYGMRMAFIVSIAIALVGLPTILLLPGRRPRHA